MSLANGSSFLVTAYSFPFYLKNQNMNKKPIPKKAAKTTKKGTSKRNGITACKDDRLTFQQVKDIADAIRIMEEIETPEQVTTTQPPQQTEYTILTKVLTQAQEWRLQDEPLIETSYLRTATELIKQMIHNRHLSQLPSE